MYYEIYQRYEEIRRASNAKEAFSIVCDEYGLDETDLNELLNESED